MELVLVLAARPGVISEGRPPEAAEIVVFLEVASWAWTSDEIDERWEAASSWSDSSGDTECKPCTRPSSSVAAVRLLLDAYPKLAAFAAERKLVVDGGWRMLPAFGGKLDPC